MAMYYHCEDDDFKSFVREQLMFRKVVEVHQMNDGQTAELVLDNGVVLVAQGNEGCGGCERGWYYLSALNTCDNAITNVEFVESGDEEVFSIFVYSADNRINLLTYEGYDNGYYGVGYTIHVKIGG
jgi:hypothetical protein